MCNWRFRLIINHAKLDRFLYHKMQFEWSFKNEKMSTAKKCFSHESRWNSATRYVLYRASRRTPLQRGLLWWPTLHVRVSYRRTAGPCYVTVTEYRRTSLATDARTVRSPENAPSAPQRNGIANSCRIYALPILLSSWMSSRLLPWAETRVYTGCPRRWTR